MLVVIDVSCCSFFDNMVRILSTNFTPNVDDVLRARVRTTGIIETNFRVGDVTYK